MELKDRLKQARKHARITQADLAARAGIKQASISEIERGLTRTSGHIVKLATVCGVDPAWLSEGIGQMLGAETSNVEVGPPITSVTRRIEIVGTAQLGPDGYWVGLDGKDGWVETYSRDEDAYALRLKGDSMAPAIRNGWIAVCEPNHRRVPGEYVMVTTKDGQSMVKELLYENDEGVSLMSVNTAYGERRTLDWDEIDKIHYVGNILAPSKVLGRY
ncbi:helix-turn-helix transcriptional regulator [Pseudomonas lactis]|uniref:Helix-turn-helix transcriptional regulator n=1 Tax=Pseudomonas lactis TaxID=1615674 RepID=A0A7Y1QE40_9PSED|nr:S24 family peptidase [Pseudomonas lactis]NNA76728.1 helix-turn-helix transcriptional regulator [Pseudomonas lactis]